MTPRSEVDVLESELRRQGPLLDILLLDRTSSRIARKKHNIIWATNSYVTTGKRSDPFLPTKQMKPNLVTGEYGKLIQPRAVKSKEEQKRRTKDKAEVFTPLSIVREMNSAIDQAMGEKPQPGHTWEDYVKALKLEITCGEAPFIVSRYDPTKSGKDSTIPIHRRVGFLDEKLKIVSKYCDDKDEWFKWVVEAYKASYGYEWQGDNLLIARENLLYTFYDYWRAKFDKSDKALPPKEWRLEIATIISWNIWQMDGLKYVIPMSQHKGEKLVKISKAPKIIQQPLLGLDMGSQEKKQTELFVCRECERKGEKYHDGYQAIIIDWSRGGKKGRKVKFVELLNNA